MPSTKAFQGVGARSLQLQEKGKKIIPGLTRLLSKRPDQFSSGLWPGHYSRASGAQVWDLDGNEYSDMNICDIEPLSHFVFECDEWLSMKALFVQEMMQRGILASNLCYAMYAHTPQHVERCLKAVEEAFGVVNDAWRVGDTESRLIGKPAVAGFKRLA